MISYFSNNTVFKARYGIVLFASHCIAKMRRHLFALNVFLITVNFLQSAPSEYGNAVEVSKDHAFLQRALRRTSPKNQASKICCGKTRVLSVDIMNTLSECKTQIKQDSIRKADGNCAVVCAATRLGVVDDYGYVKQEEFSEALAGYYAEMNVKNTATAVLKECMKYNDVARQIMRKDPERCNPAISMVMRCVNILVELKCPEENKVKSTECDKQRQKWKKMAQRRGHEPDE